MPLAVFSSPPPRPITHTYTQYTYNKKLPLNYTTDWLCHQFSNTLGPSLRQALGVLLSCLTAHHYHFLLLHDLENLLLSLSLKLLLVLQDSEEEKGWECG